MSQVARQLSVVVCGAAPTADVGVLVRLAQQRSWTVRAVPTPDALSFVDAPALESMTGNSVEVGYRSPSDARPPRPDAVIVAPATFNTVNKAALGITDTHALGVIAEAIGRSVPVVMVPWVNVPLAAREPFRRSLAQLRDEGVRILLREDDLEPRPFGVDANDINAFPWQAALDIAEGESAPRS
ncbi:MAG: flavoprotein [Actinobacteria bacterium]|nr:flavoprotein [Actinomycetota bacterium]